MGTDKDQKNVTRCKVCGDPLPVDYNGDVVEHKNCQINDVGNIVYN